MGATVVAYWPGITDGQIDSQPGFYNDDKAWGDWMAEREGEPLVLEAINQLNAGAILTCSTEGMEAENVRWVTPRQLCEAAARLRDAVRAGRPEATVILASYQRNANCLDPVAEEFIRDLDDIEAIAMWAEEEGAERMTLEAGW